MMWIYIIIGIIVVIGIIYWLKSRSKGGEPEMPASPEAPSPSGPAETPESSSSEEEKPM